MVYTVDNRYSIFATKKLFIDKSKDGSVEFFLLGKNDKSGVIVLEYKIFIYKYIYH